MTGVLDRQHKCVDFALRRKIRQAGIGRVIRHPVATVLFWLDLARESVLLAMPRTRSQVRVEDWAKLSFREDATWRSVLKHRLYGMTDFLKTAIEHTHIFQTLSLAHLADNVKPLKPPNLSFIKTWVEANLDAPAFAGYRMFCGDDETSPAILDKAAACGASYPASRVLTPQRDTCDLHPI